MFTNIIAWMRRKTDPMANPLILTEEEWMPRQAEFAVYDKAYSEPAVSTVEPKAWTMRARRMIMDSLASMAKAGGTQRPDDNSVSAIAQAPVWGPTVKAAEAVSIYFRLVAQGTEDQFESTDGMRIAPSPASSQAIFAPSPEPMGSGSQGSNLPGMDAQGSGGGGSYSRNGDHIDPRLIAAEVLLKQIDEAKALLAHQQDALPIPPTTPQKLYRVTEAIEVTADEIGAEMGKVKRKNSKPVVYIKGSIVEPRLRVEI